MSARVKNLQTHGVAGWTGPASVCKAGKRWGADESCNGPSWKAQVQASGQSPSYYILQYSYVPDILEKRDPHREGHLSAIRKALADKKMVIGGAVADPIDGGLLVFENSTKEEVEAYVEADPYHKGGLIASYTIRPYLVVKQQ